MEPISKAITWRREPLKHGDVEITGTYSVSSMAKISSYVAHDPQVEEQAKRDMARNLWQMLYGDIARELIRLEHILYVVLPAEYVTSDNGPVALVQELQNKLAERK